MLSGTIILLTSLGYLMALFALAYYGDRKARDGTGTYLVSNPYVYSLSIAVYCTSWTYYGSVGRAAVSGFGFLPIYLGPTIVFTLGWFVLRKILRICKAQRITSIADFIGSRYGKSQAIGSLVTVIAVVGIVPYIALQLKAVSMSFGVVLRQDQDVLATAITADSMAFIVTLVLAVFPVLFGTRHIEATEHHAGLVVAIAAESLVKLLAFLAVGAFVTFALYDGFADIFAKAAANANTAHLVGMEKSAGNWVTLTLLSMTAIICLPRQFHVTFVENTNETHLNRALWLFPLYLFIINLFVLPIALGGLMWLPKDIDADTYVLALPLAEHNAALTLVVLVGGLSAAAAMVIVETIALSTMVCNDLIMPALLRFSSTRLTGSRDLTSLLLNIRRVAIIGILLLGYFYLAVVGNTYHLVTIGLVSFCAAAQLAPALLFALYWRGGTRRAVIAGLTLGFTVWLYTLLLPSFARSGFLPDSFIKEGLFGIALLKPYALFGLEGLDNISHSLFWSMLFNVGGFLAVAMTDRQTRIERIQATLFVEAFSAQTSAAGSDIVLSGEDGRASVQALLELATRYVGRDRAAEAFNAYARRQGVAAGQPPEWDSGLMRLTERLVAGSIGAASARVAVASAVKGERVQLDEIMQILDETQHVLEYSRQLEEKSHALEVASRDLEAANRQLLEADRLKDEFMSTVSHELRTPLTSIRSFSEILQDDPDMPSEQRSAFLGIIVSESERLTRLINQVLDLAKIEAGRMQWHIRDVDVDHVVRDAAASLAPIFERDGVEMEIRIDDRLGPVRADADRLIQVIINLVSNAEKFCPKPGGKVAIVARRDGDMARLSVIDNGPGIPEAEREAIFDKFYQVRANNQLDANPLGMAGTGLGLAISERIVVQFGGRIWVEATSSAGSTFTFTVPLSRSTGTGSGTETNAGEKQHTAAAAPALGE